MEGESPHKVPEKPNLADDKAVGRVTQEYDPKEPHSLRQEDPSQPK